MNNLNNQENKNKNLSIEQYNTLRDKFREEYKKYSMENDKKTIFEKREKWK